MKSSQTLAQARRSPFAARARIICVLLTIPQAQLFAQAHPHSVGRPLSVSDLVGLGALVTWRPANIAAFSPDGRRVAMVVQRGDLVHNRIVYTFLVIPLTPGADSRPIVDTVLTLAAVPAAPPMHALQWLGDNATLVFLGSGEREGSPVGGVVRDSLAEQLASRPQVYALNIWTRRLRRLTAAPGGVTSFSMTPSGTTLTYGVPVEAEHVDAQTRAAHGFTVRMGEGIDDLVPALTDVGDPGLAVSQRGERFFVQRLTEGAEPARPRPVIMPTDGSQCVGFFPPPLSLAPSGQYGVAECSVAHPSPRWAAYADTMVKRLVQSANRRNVSSFLDQLMLIDVERGTMTPLIDAPLGRHSSVVWAPDGRSLVLGGGYLPLDSGALAHPHTGPWQSDVMLEEVAVPSGRVTPIRQGGDYTVVRWDSPTQTIDISRDESDEQGRWQFRKVAGQWTSLGSDSMGGHSVASGAAVKDVTSNGRYEVALEQGLNQPPHVILTNLATGHRVTLLDLNRQLAGRALAREDTVSWTDRLGGHWTAGLYWPVHYQTGKRYPLVIQTHGFDPLRWEPTGMPTVGAAQVLAGRDVFVLQIADGGTSHWGAITGEPEGAMAGFEGAVDALDARGWVDRTRVGLVGWSRTCWYVTFTLTHSSYPFAAAIIADGANFGYTEYAQAQTPGAADVTSEYDQRYGGPPWGASAPAWQADAPEFRLDRVHTPLRIEAIVPASLLSLWTWYSGLFRLGAPAELAYFPLGDHVLHAPWELETSLQGTVDWFAFWLKGEEDTTPAKADQYARWHVLRAMRDSSAARTAVAEHVSPAIRDTAR